MKLKYIKYFILLISLSAKSQNQFVVFDTTNAPLPSNQPMNLAIDLDGSYWFCFYPDRVGSQYVKGGLAKFNGYEWEIFTKENSPLPTNFVNSIAIDKLGHKWIATEDGLVKLVGNEWVVYNTQNSPLLENNIWNVNIEGDTIIWVSSLSTGYYKFDGVSWNNFNTSNTPLYSNQANFVLTDNDGNKWFGADLSPLISFNGSSWQIHGVFPFAPGPSPGWANPDIRSMAIEKDGDKWIVGRGWYGQNMPRYSAIAKFNQSGWTIFDSSSLGFTFVPNYSGLAIDTNNIKWITAYDKGIIKYDDSNFFVFDQTNSPILGSISIVVDKMNNKIFTARLNKVSPSGNYLNGIVFYNENGVILKTENLNGNIVNEFILNQNYPNPFNSSTNIEFYLPRKNFVSLKIYDVFGRLVRTIIEKELEAGRHIYQFNADKLSSGVYIYQLKSGKFKQSNKMLLIK